MGLYFSFSLYSFSYKKTVFTFEHAYKLLVFLFCFVLCVNLTLGNLRSFHQATLCLPFSILFPKFNFTLFLYTSNPKTLP